VVTPSGSVCLLENFSVFNIRKGKKLKGKKEKVIKTKRKEREGIM